jgi:hypothetical protein
LIKCNSLSDRLKIMNRYRSVVMFVINQQKKTELNSKSESFSDLSFSNDSHEKNKRNLVLCELEDDILNRLERDTHNIMNQTIEEIILSEMRKLNCDDKSYFAEQNRVYLVSELFDLYMMNNLIKYNVGPS